MIAAWMAYTMLVGALLAVAALGAESALRSARRSIRFVWGAAIALTFVFAVVAPMRRAQPVDVAALAALAVTANASQPLVPLSLWERTRDEVREAAATLSAPIELASLRVASVVQSHNRWLLAAWALASAIAFVVFASAYGRFARNRSAWPNARVQGVPVRITPDVGPAVMGIAPPTIVIPQWVLARNDREQQLIVAHEREHVRAHDPLLLLLCCIAVALMPWNAALWFMWSRLRLAVEVDCDNRVLHSGAPKASYSHLLLELSAQRARVSPLMPAFTFGTSHLEQRLVAMTTRPSRYQIVRRVASLSVVTVALVAACNSELPTSDQIKKLDVPTAVTKYPALAQANFVVDGKAATFTEASAIPAGRISSIEVTHPAKSSAQPYVNIKLNSEDTDSMSGDTIALRNGATITAARGDSGGVSYSQYTSKRTTATFDSGRVAVTLRGDTIAVRDPQAIRLAIPGNTIVLRDQSMSSSSRGDSARAFPKLGANADSTRGDPLVFIDGVEVGNAFKMLNPKDIATVEVIKGFRARELYGQGAINGVILITLKH